VIDTDCIGIGSCKSNYHTITTTAAHKNQRYTVAVIEFHC
jgi:hypothetical protein